MHRTWVAGHFLAPAGGVCLAPQPLLCCHVCHACRPPRAWHTARAAMTSPCSTCSPTPGGAAAMRWAGFVFGAPGPSKLCGASPLGGGGGGGGGMAFRANRQWLLSQLTRHPPWFPSYDNFSGEMHPVEWVKQVQAKSTPGCQWKVRHAKAGAPKCPRTMSKWGLQNAPHPRAAGWAGVGRQEQWAALCLSCGTISHKRPLPLAALPACCPSWPLLHPAPSSRLCCARRACCAGAAGHRGLRALPPHQPLPHPGRLHLHLLL